MSGLVGWWMIPAALTVAGYVRFAVWVRRQPKGGGYRIGEGLGELLMFAAATAWSLFVWLVYFIALQVAS